MVGAEDHPALDGGDERRRLGKILPEPEVAVIGVRLNIYFDIIISESKSEGKNDEKKNQDPADFRIVFRIIGRGVGALQVPPL